MKTIKPPSIIVNGLATALLKIQGGIIFENCFNKGTERVQRATIGITVTINDSKAVYDSEIGLVTIEETVSVYEVAKDSLIDGVLQKGDVILNVTLNGENKRITRQHQIIDMLLDVRVGDVWYFEILRDGEKETCNIVITEDCLTEY